MAEGKNDKDKKPPQKGKKEKKDELSEEDKEKKEEIELIVQRSQDVDVNIQRAAIEALRTEVRSTTGSISSIPKGLKFLRPHYNTLKGVWERAEGENKINLADVMSVLAMTMVESDSRDSLKFRLEGSKGGIDVWGHEYVRNLSHEIIEEFVVRQNEEKPFDDLMDLVDQIIPFDMAHNAEPAACDLLLEVERLGSILDYVDEKNYERVCLYLLGNARYTPEPEDSEILKLVVNIYRKLNKYPEAVAVALQLDDAPLAQEILNSCEDRTTKKQIAFILGRQNMFRVEFPEDDSEVANLMGNTKLSDHYRKLAAELDVLEPKAPEDIYKTHLLDTRYAQNLRQNHDSAKQNLASSFVNAFVNCGFGTDKLLADEDSQWIFENKDHAKMSVAASLGLVYLWDSDVGTGKLDRYFYASEPYIKAGGMLGVGIANCGVQSEHDPALAMLSYEVSGDSDITKIGALLGLGIAYAGTGREVLIEMFTPIIEDESASMQLVSIAAYSLGLIFVGTYHPDIVQTLTNVLFERSAEDLSNTYSRFLCLGLGLLFLGKQSEADLVLESLKVLADKGPISKYASYTVTTCAYAGTGNVLKIQEMLRACGEHLEEEKDSGFQAVAALGISVIGMSEELGQEMVIRMTDHLLQYGEPVIRRTIPLALGLISISNPRLTVMDTLSKLSHDTDGDVAQGAIFALGMIGAGTNNSRIAGMLRQLSGYYSKDPNHLFIVRVAQGLLHLGKGLLTINPYHQHNNLMNKVAVAGLLGVMHACLDFSGLIHDSAHYLLLLSSVAMHPRMLMTFDENLELLNTSVRVGQAVDTVGQAGKPKTITGFQTHTTPVLISFGERAELATDDYIAASPFLEHCVILKPNPNAKKD